MLLNKCPLNRTFQLMLQSNKVSYQSLENVSTPSVSVSATSSGSLEKDFEEFVSAMTLKYGITKKAVVERCGCKTAMFWKSCRGRNGWNQFVSETVKDDNDRTGEMESSGDSNDNGNSNCSINFPDMDAISANWKALSEEEKQLYASRAQSYNERNLLEGFLNKDDIAEQVAVTEECLNSMQLQVNFLSRRCGIDSFIVLDLKWRSICCKKPLGLEPVSFDLDIWNQFDELYVERGFAFLQLLGLITSSGGTPSAPMAMRVGSAGNNTPYRSSAIPRYNPDIGTKQLKSKKLVRKEIGDLLYA
ncbi:hypothetical protein BDC45DRAFT_542424 [Circinella umbellata]|nr:hypothetical protein BDC45DRAFT_542424 [Circinella umbellata]